jgi:hypothetical protein
VPLLLAVVVVVVVVVVGDRGKEQLSEVGEETRLFIGVGFVGGCLRAVSPVNGSSHVRY